VVEVADTRVAHPESKLGIAGVGTAITGPRVHRGKAIPALTGKSAFHRLECTVSEAVGPVVRGTAAEPRRRGMAARAVPQIDSLIIGLAEDAAGEIYVLTHEGLGPFGNTGKVLKLVTRP
jgi:hypothetical protein